MRAKNIICILLIAAMCLPLVGCNPSGTGMVRCHTEDYDILIRDGKWYLYLSEEMYSWCEEMHVRRNRHDDPLISPDGEVVGSKFSWDAPTASFSSVQHMREAFLTGNIPRTSLYRWSLQNAGYHAPIVRREFEMLNLDDLYVPVVPEGVSLKSILVSNPCKLGMSIIIDGRTKGDDESWGVGYHTQSSFKSSFEYEYESDFEGFKSSVETGPVERTMYSEKIDVETGRHTVIGRKLDSPFDSPQTYVRYALNASAPGYYVKKDGIDYTADGTAYVIEKYQFGEFESKVDVYVHIPCQNGGVVVRLINMRLKERDIEWLSQFGAIPLSEYEASMTGTE